MLNHSFRCWAATAAVVTIGVLSGHSVTAQQARARLLRDINLRGSSAPRGMVEVGGAVFFNANDGVRGEELWRTNGTAAGTVLAKDICVRPDSYRVCTAAGGSNPGWLTGHNNLLFFAAADRTKGRELMESRGTPATTRLRADIEAGTQSSDPAGITSLPGKGQVFFSATQIGVGRELFLTSTVDGQTRLAKDINPGPLPSNPLFLTVNEETLLFQATDAASGAELWMSDGTAEGTTLLKDIAPGATDSKPRFLTQVYLKLGSRLFFVANDGENGGELWMTDGTADGTVLVKDIVPGPGGSNPRFLTSAHTRLFFVASDGVHGEELWTTDGTAEGTVMVKDVRPGPDSSAPANLTDVFDLGDLGHWIFFSADDGVHGVELWRSDGTEEGTELVLDIAPGARSSSPASLFGGYNALFFNADDGIHGRELWSSDGSTDGTRLAMDIARGARSSNPQGFIRYGTQIFFSANDGIRGIELWTLSNRKPVAEAGSDQTVSEGGTVTLDGSASSDPDRDPLTYEWMDNHGVLLGHGRVLQTTLPNGTHYVNLLVRDAFSGVDADSLIVHVGPVFQLMVEARSMNGASGAVGVDWQESCIVTANGSSLCTYSYAVGSVVALQALSFDFAGWEGACTGTEVHCEIRITGDTHVTAIFRGPQALWLNPYGVEGGTGSIFNPSGASCQTGGAGESAWCESKHPVGTVVTLDAYPGPNSVFVEWTGACLGSDPHCQVTISDSPQAVSAVFRGPQTLGLNPYGIEGGTGVVVGPSGFNCNTGPVGETVWCERKFALGTVVTLDAFAGLDSVFVEWTGACTGTNPRCVVALANGPQAVGAVFRGPQTLGLNPYGIEGGTGVVFGPSGFNCNTGPSGETVWCERKFALGTVVTLDAFAGLDSVFVEWTGACMGTNPRCVVTLANGPQAVGAVFRGPQALWLNPSGIEGGTGGIVGPSGFNCNTGPFGETVWCDRKFAVGTVVPLDAYAGPDSVFVEWRGACSGPSPTCTVTLTQGPIVVEAIFRGTQAPTIDGSNGS